MRKLSSTDHTDPRTTRSPWLALALCFASTALAGEPGAPDGKTPPPPALSDDPGNATAAILPRGPLHVDALKSTESKTHSTIRFENRTARKVVLYWIDQNGQRKRYGGVPPGKARRVHTYVTHVWMVTDEADKPVSVFTAEGSDSVAVVHPTLTAFAADQEASLRSIESKTPASIRFVNQTPNLIHVYWIDYEGRRNLRGRVPPQKDLTLETFVTHPWVVTTESGETLGVFKPHAGENAAIVEAQP